jgi:hypothetical protein
LASQLAHRGLSEYCSSRAPKVGVTYVERNAFKQTLTAESIAPWYCPHAL